MNHLKVHAFVPDTQEAIDYGKDCIKLALVWNLFLAGCKNIMKKYLKAKLHLIHIHKLEHYDARAMHLNQRGACSSKAVQFRRKAIQITDYE